MIASKRRLVRYSPMVRPRLLCRLAVVAALVATAGCESTATTTATLEDPAPAVVSIRGKIGAPMIGQFDHMLPNGAPGGAVVYLASGGGDFAVALKIAQRLEALPSSTAVVTRGCESASVVIFLAAHQRLVAPTAVVSVHRPKCTADGVIGLPCRVFWEPWARREFHERIARVSPRWAEYLDSQDPPAFERSGAEFVRVTGAQLIAFGVAAPYTREALRTIARAGS